jgi:hypothetical protein
MMTREGEPLKSFIARMEQQRKQQPAAVIPPRNHPMSQSDYDPASAAAARAQAKAIMAEERELRALGVTAEELEIAQKLGVSAEKYIQQKRALSACGARK